MDGAAPTAAVQPVSIGVGVAAEDDATSVDAGTPQTGATSRQSVGNSEDTMCAPEEQPSNIDKVLSPVLPTALGGVVVTSPVGAVPNGQAVGAPADIAMDVDADGDIDAEGEMDDAEGEIDAEGELDVEGEDDIDAEGEPDTGEDIELDNF